MKQRGKSMPAREAKSFGGGGGGVGGGQKYSVMNPYIWKMICSPFQKTVFSIKKQKLEK